MNNYVDKFTKSQINEQCKYLYGITLDLLYKKEEGYEYLDNRVQSVINIISGCNVIFNNSPKVMTVCSLLETARTEPKQFRKCIMDSLGFIDELKNDVLGGNTHV